MSHSNLFFRNPLDASVLKARRSAKAGEGSDPRGNYFRDVTAIIHSYPFRRLKHKTQVFYAPKNDHICTRIEHVMHVASVASTICRALDLNSDLAWAIGLGHDLGHTPFGHLGEQILAELSGQPFSHELYSLKTVDSLDGALQHIACYSSQHSECIVSEDTGACARFTREVDAACVYTNVSTAFTDGGQFGFGAEIGISTQKLHARGPMALPELTSYKYIVTGNGQVRK